MEPFVIFKNICLFLYLFLASLGIRCRGLSLVESRGYSNCNAQASLWGGFSCWGARALGCVGFGSSGSQL